MQQSISINCEEVNDLFLVDYTFKSMLGEHIGNTYYKFRALLVLISFLLFIYDNNVQVKLTKRHDLYTKTMS